MPRQALLVKTRDGRRFLTTRDNAPHLAEFVRTIKAELHLVLPEEGEKLLGLRAVVKGLCGSEQVAAPRYRKLKKLYPVANRRRSDLIADAKTIRHYIRRRLLAGHEVSLNGLWARYPGVGQRALVDHFAAVRNQLIDAGHDVRQTAPGCHRIG